MPSSLVWHLWPGRHWPASPTEEARFVDDLHTAAGDHVARPERMDVTAVLNALRCGVPLADLLRFAPGVNPAALLAAYRDLEVRRASSADAWTAITTKPTLATITEHAPLASQLLPVPVYRLVTAAEIAAGGPLSRVVSGVIGDIRAAVQRAAGVEAALARLSPHEEQGVALGAILHNPHEPGLWGHPYFLPSRVGALSPMRVADLLGERPR